MSKRIAIGVDSGGNHISSIACHIEKKSTCLKISHKTIWVFKEQLMKSSVSGARHKYYLFCNFKILNLS